MRIAELPLDEQNRIRQYNREAKKRSREKQKQAQMPSYDEAFDNFPPEHTNALRQHVKEVATAVKSELGVEGLGGYQDNQAAESAIHQLAWTLFAFKRNLVQQVHSPPGELVGGTYYADSLGADIVTSAHRYSLLNSATFAALFNELLPILHQRYGDEDTKHSRAVREELGR